MFFFLQKCFFYKNVSSTKNGPINIDDHFYEIIYLQEIKFMTMTGKTRYKVCP